MTLAGVANAKDIAFAKSPNGGTIVLTDNFCISNGERFTRVFRAYSYFNTGKVTEGCWGDRGETIAVLWLLDGPNTATVNYKNTDFTWSQK